jgi:hypothetical protein
VGSRREPRFTLDLYFSRNERAIANSTAMQEIASFGVDGHSTAGGQLTACFIACSASKCRRNLSTQAVKRLAIWLVEQTSAYIQSGIVAD